jgi:hypothetical protein
MSDQTNGMSASEKKKEDWMNSKWRPMMGWMYMLVCTCDFVIFPVLWSLVQAMTHGNVSTQWQPVTLQGAGLFHMAMGAVIGVAAFGRTQEKLAGKANDNSTPSFGSPAPTSAPVSNSFGSPAPVSNSFSSPAPASSGFGSATPATNSFASTPSIGVNASGKKVVPDAEQPPL